MNDVEGMRANWEASLPGGPNAFQRAQFDRRVEELRAELEECKENYACFDAALQDMGALRDITQFYRLAAAWLIWVATEGKDASGGSDLARAAAAAEAGEPSAARLLPRRRPNRGRSCRNTSWTTSPSFCCTCAAS